MIGPDQNDMAALAAILQPEIDALTAQGVNKIVLVSHLQQIVLEQELAGLLNGVDVIVAGGSDTLLADGEDVGRGLQPGDTPDGGYPFQATDAAGNPVLIVGTDGEYSYVGRLVVTFDDSGVVIPGSVDPNVSGTFATTDAGVTALFGANNAFEAGTDAAAVQALVGETIDIVTEQDSVIFGSTTVFLDGRRSEVRTEETNLGNLTADANLFVAQQIDSTVQVSIKNGGGIRDAIGSVGDDGELLPTVANPASGKQEGEISQLDIANSLRFNNGLTLLTLTAEDLRIILEQGVAGTEDGATPGQFPQVSGISFSFDATGQAIAFDDEGNIVTQGNRIQNAAITDEDGNIVDVLVQNGVVVGDPNRDIRVVTLNFLADGGDGYPFDVLGENRIDLFSEDDAAPRTGAATFVGDGTEQDAFAEFLNANFSTTPFSIEETDPENDTRLQNLSVRADTVLTTFIEIDGGIGTLGNDIITGTDADDILRGNNGDDVIAGLGGDDTIFGGRGDDEINGGAGDDDIRGLAGDDTIFGGVGNDRIRGNAGSDEMFGNAGEDDMLGGKGSDRLNGGSNDDLMRGAKGNDVLLGGSGNDIIYGGRGNDSLVGGSGNDLLRADAGDDILEGGQGNDEIRTGAGDDFVILGAGVGTDTIFRFDAQGDDQILLTDISFDDLSLNVVGSNTEIVFGAQTLAVVVNNTSLTGADFDQLVVPAPQPVI